MKTKLLVIILEIVVLFIFFSCNSVYYLIPPSKRGFHCQDQSIAYAFKSDTVSDATLMIVSVAIPIIFITCVELIKRACYTRCAPNKYGEKNVIKIATESYRWLIRFCTGFTAVMLLVFIGKILVGRLRPHFLAVCQPVGYTSLCRADNIGAYITNYTCKHEGDAAYAHRLKEARVSWPSGHAAFSFYAAVFLAAYLQSQSSKLSLRDSRFNGFVLLIPVLQVGCLSWGFLASLTRISDNKHHWSDVLSGGIIGIIGGVVATYFKTSLDVSVTNEILQLDAVNHSSSITPSSMDSH